MLRFQTFLVVAVLISAPQASAHDLKIVTWNLTWLTTRQADLPPGVSAKTDADLERLAGYAAALRADVVAIQGVDSVADAARLFPPDRYDIILSGDAVRQHTGFAVRHGIGVQRHADLDQLDLYRNARLHLRAAADITLRWGGVTLRLLSVHLKSGCREAPLDRDDPACAALRAQAAILHDWAVARREPFGILGDFGRVMDGADDMLPLLAGDRPLARVTAGQASPCWGGQPFTDHLLFSPEASGWVRSDSLRVMVFRETGGAWLDRLGRHCPVSVRLHLPD